MEDLINVNELAKRMGVHYNTIYNLVRKGDIPYIRLGDGAYRFNYSEVLERLKGGDE